MKGFFICFTGIDGSGKSTISKKLVEVMNNNGINSVYVYNRYKPLLLRPFLFIGEKLFLRNKNFFKDYSDYSTTKKEATKNHSILSALYQYFVIIDYFLQSTYKITIPLYLGRNIICDRYIYDTLVTDLAVDFNYTNENVLKLLNKMMTIFPKPNKVFFIDVPVDIAFKRKNDVPSIKYLEDRVDFFNFIINSYNYIRVDGSGNVNEIMNVVKREVLK